MRFPKRFWQIRDVETFCGVEVQPVKEGGLIANFIAVMAGVGRDNQNAARMNGVGLMMDVHIECPLRHYDDVKTIDAVSIGMHISWTVGGVAGNNEIGIGGNRNIQIRHDLDPFKLIFLYIIVP